MAESRSLTMTARNTTAKERTTRRTYKTAGITLILISGVIHLSLAPDHFKEAAYLGSLFGIEFVGTVIVAIGIYLGDRRGWLLGALITIIALLLYLIHGTIGLPIVGAEELLEPMGIVTKVVEALYLLLTLYVLKT